MARSRAILFLAAAVVFSIWLWWPQQQPVGKQPGAVPLKVTAQPHPLTPNLLTKIRVKLTADGASDFELQIDGPYRLQPVGNSRFLWKAAKLEPVKVTASATGIQIGHKNYPVTRLEILPDQSPAIWVNGRKYRGTIRIFRRPGGRLMAVNALPIEEYVASVTDSEMPAAFPAEARKAQAVVARTYALYQISQKSRQALYDVYADTRSQKYLGYQYRDSNGRLLAGETASGREIARQTYGMVCTYRGKLFCTYYSAVCGGCTLIGSELFADAVPALTTVPCEYCRESKYYRWDITLSRSQLKQQLSSTSASGAQLGPLVSLQEISPSKPGRLKQFDVRFQQGKQKIRGDKLRSALSASGARSPHFSVQRQGDQFIFHGRGHGHGAGLCQWGARGQALQGRNFQQILGHYYPGTDLVIVTATPSQN